MPKLPSTRLMIAAAVALIADIVQWLIPMSSAGLFNPIVDVIDFAVGGIMVSLLGWHWALLPSMMGKLVPGVDLVPFWSAAVFIVGAGEQYGQALPGIPGMPVMPNAAQNTFVPHGTQNPTLTIPAQPAAPQSSNQPTH